MSGRTATSPSDLLHEAAALMRQRARAATPGPWCVDSPVESEWSGVHRVDRSGEPVERYLAARMDDYDAEHVATWHPAVALAVADWLDKVAENWDDGIVAMFGARNHRDWPAVAVARAYLGRPS